MAKTSAKAGRRISKSKTKGMKINTTNAGMQSRTGWVDIEEVEDFVYLGSNISKDGGSDRDIQVRIGKARTAFTILRPVWKSKTISRKTKLRIFNTNLKSVLLYGSESWRVTKATCNKLQSFVGRCLRSIMGIHLPEVIRNEELNRNESRSRLEGANRTHPQKTEQQYYQACIEVEPTGKMKTWSSQKQPEENHGQRGGQGRLHLDENREVGPNKGRTVRRWRAVSMWTYAPQGVKGNKSSKSLVWII